MKKIISFLLALTLAFSLSLPALAADSEAALSSAKLLYELGLFQGVGTDKNGNVQFALDRAPTRAEAVTMLVRLLGKEDEAKSGTWLLPFQDIPKWAVPYIGYAYENGLTNGLTSTNFGSNSPVTTAQYLIFLLRALGYRDDKDFSLKSPWTMTDALGITDGEYNSTTKTFLRADAAVVSANALYATRRTGTARTLLHYLLDNNGLSNSSVVIWDYSPIIFESGRVCFLFYPVSGTPATFRSFHIDKVTVNGLPCTSMQINTPDGVSAYLASMGYSEGGFGYIEVTFDQQAAKEAGLLCQDPDGKARTSLSFQFSFTAEQSNGKTIRDTFVAPYYL